VWLCFGGHGDSRAVTWAKAADLGFELIRAICPISICSSPHNRNSAAATGQCSDGWVRDHLSTRVML
jgi:hypothetical protein